MIFGAKWDRIVIHSVFLQNFKVCIFIRICIDMMFWCTVWSVNENLQKPPETSRNLQKPPKTGWGGFWQVFYAWSSKQHLENLQEAAKSQRATKIVFMLEICCKQKACSNKAVLIILRSYMKKQASKGHNWSRIVFYALNMLQTRNVEMRLFINESQFKLKMITCGESWGRLGQIETKISMGNHRQLSRRPKWDLEHFAFST